MTNLSEPLIFRMGRLLLACLLACLPSIAQETAPATPLSADEVIARVVEMNGVRAEALENYSSIRSYHLECHCLSQKNADMLVRVEYQAPNKKEFTIVSESGSAAVRNKVFKKLLEAEQESARQENQQRSAITSENYTFAVVDYQKTEASEFYVLDAQPRNKNKFLFRGRIWVDARDFAITRVEGEPAVNPSWWTVKTDFKRSYEKVGNFWLPESNESTTKVRIFGTAVLTISYRDYQITQVPGRKGTPSAVKPSEVKPSDNPSGEVDGAHGRTDTTSMIGLKVESEITENAVRQ
jgi:outer membrane lipoprotein-sorting protein